MSEKTKKKQRVSDKLHLLVSLGDLVEVKTYIQNKGWEWLGRVGKVTSVGDKKMCYRVDFKDDFGFYKSDQIRKANSVIDGK